MPGMRRRSFLGQRRRIDLEIHVGTSGYSYKAWKGPFYPEKLAASKFLTYYADHFGAVEVNNTFYRLPKAEMLQGWTEQTPEDFRFVLKASKRITHQAKLGESGFDALDYFLETSETLGVRRGPFLFQPLKESSKRFTLRWGRQHLCDHG